MNPILFSGTFIVAVLLGMWICEWRITDQVLARKSYLIGIGCGILGARLWHMAQYGDFSLRGGWAIWGFFLGASVGVTAYLLIKKDRYVLAEFADAVAPAAALAAAIVRVSCFYIGCNFGKVTELPWGVTYPPGSLAFQKHVSDGLIDSSALTSLPVHPTQLYESAALAIGAGAVLSIPALRRIRSGKVLLWGSIYYCLFRFSVEFIRDDSGGTHFGPLTFAQGTSGVVLLVSLLVLFLYRVQKWKSSTD